MARKKIREYDSKRLFKAHYQRIAGIALPINVAQVKETTNWTELIAANPWLTQQKLVVKPDMLFGQRHGFQGPPPLTIAGHLSSTFVLGSNTLQGQTRPRGSQPRRPAGRGLHHRSHE
jgi:hypothetical protein